MPSDRVGAALSEILNNIELAERFTHDVTVDHFAHDLLRIYATTRALEIISEASRRLPDDLKARHPDVPWRQIAGAGNIYRHGYDVVAPEVIWQTVRTGLTRLREAVRTEIARHH